MLLKNITSPSMAGLMQQCVSFNSTLIDDAIGSKKKIKKFILEHLTTDPAIVVKMMQLVSVAKYGGILTLKDNPSFMALLLAPSGAYLGGSDVFLFCKVTDRACGKQLARVYMHTNATYSVPIAERITDANGALIPKMLSGSSIFELKHFIYSMSHAWRNPDYVSPLSVCINPRTIKATTAADFQAIVDVLNSKSPIAYWAHVKKALITEMLGYEHVMDFPGVEDKKANLLVPVTWLDVVASNQVIRVLAVTKKQPPLTISDVVCIPHSTQIHLFDIGLKLPTMFGASIESALKVHSKFAMPNPVMVATWGCSADGPRATAANLWTVSGSKFPFEFNRLQCGKVVPCQ